MTEMIRPDGDSALQQFTDESTNRSIDNGDASGSVASVEDSGPVEGTPEVGVAAGDGEESAGVPSALTQPPIEPPGGEDVPQPELDDRQLLAAVEAVLFVIEAPVSSASIAAALQCTTGRVEGALRELTDVLVQRGSGLEVRSVAGGFRLYTRPEVSDAVAAFLLDGQRSKLSQAALETLSVIAYRQPVTRARISAIRGVNVDGVVRTLLSRGLVVEAGSDPDTGGGVFRTTDLFLERLGLDSISELPSLAPLLPDLELFESEQL